MHHLSRRLVLVTLLALPMAACKSGAADAPAPSGGQAPAAADNAAVAPVANVGIQGTFTGTLDKAGEQVPNHAVTVMTDGQGNPQVGFWEFCNVDMTGEGPEYTSVDGASCFVDLGDGQKPHAATATARYENDSLTASVTFDGGAATWSFTGTR